MFVFYLQYDNGRVVRVQTPDSRLKDKIFSGYILKTGRQPLKKITPLIEDFTLDIKLSSKKAAKQRRTLPFVPKFPVSIVKTTNTLLLYTPAGSQCKIDYLKRYARIIIIKEDDSSIDFWMPIIDFLVSLFMKAVRIHSAGVSNGRNLFLFVGTSSAGKSTIGRLLAEADKKNKLIEDDLTFIFSAGKNGYAYAFEEAMLYPVSHIFFLERVKGIASGISPLDYKEAFKRIIFHSDVILKNDDREVDYRLKTLEGLVCGAKSFLLKNGRGLKNNPEKLKRWIGELTKKR